MCEQINTHWFLCSKEDMFEFSSIALALILGLALASLLRHFFFTRKKPTSSLNGNMGLPFLGETIAFLKPHRSTSMGNFLQEHCSRYGKVFKSHLFGSQAIVSCDCELNMFILQNEGKLFKASYPKAMHGILGKYSLLIASGDLHKKLRNIVVNFTAVNKSNPSFLHCVEIFSLSMMETWKNCREIPFHKEVKKFTLNLMVKTLLSIEPGGPKASKILEDYLTYMKGFVSLPINIPGSNYSKAVKARARLSSTVKGIMKERKNINVDEIELAKGDFLDSILSKRLSDEETVSIVLDILLGGYETTATLTALIAYFLAHSPPALQTFKYEWQEEHQEIRRSKKDGEPLDLQDYQRMEFTLNVISEAMRCGNVVKFLHRKALQEIKYKDYTIPAGWNVLPVLIGPHFDPDIHENPFEFNPWRWNDKGMVRKVMPFGGGPRLCPGAELAKVVTAFFLHHFVLTYRWNIKPDDFPVAYPFVEFRKGLLMEIEPTK